MKEPPYIKALQALAFISLKQSCSHTIHGSILSYLLNRASYISHVKNVIFFA